MFDLLRILCLINERKVTLMNKVFLLWELYTPSSEEELVGIYSSYAIAKIESNMRYNPDNYYEYVIEMKIIDEVIWKNK